MHGEQHAGRENRAEPGAAAAEQQQPGAGDRDRGHGAATRATAADERVDPRRPDSEPGHEDPGGGAAGGGQPVDEAQIAAGQRQAAADTGFQGVRPGRRPVRGRTAGERPRRRRTGSTGTPPRRLRRSAPSEGFRARAVEDPGECQRTGAQHAAPRRRVRHGPVSCGRCGRADIAAACGLHRPFPSNFSAGTRTPPRGRSPYTNESLSLRTRVRHC